MILLVILNLETRNSFSLEMRLVTSLSLSIFPCPVAMTVLGRKITFLTNHRTTIIVM